MGFRTSDGRLPRRWNIVLTRLAVLLVSTCPIVTGSSTPDDLTTYGAQQQETGGDPSRALLSGGQIVQGDPFPFFAYIPQISGYYCAGSLIAPDMVLTTPLCTDVDNRITVGFQNMQIHLDDDISTVRSIAVHPSYNNETFDYAFAVIHLSNASSLDFVSLNADYNLPAEGTNLTILGAGRGGLTFNVLQEAHVQALGNVECESRRNPAGFPFVISSSTFCASNSGDGEDMTTGFCEDDWGGPLLQQQDGGTTMQVVGISAWTFGCGAGAPAVFARVSEGYEWIRSVVCDSSVAPPSYLACGAVGDANHTQQLEQTFETAVTESAISFQYEFGADGYFYENGVVLERIEGLVTETVHYIVPGALPYYGTFKKTIHLQQGGLYSFAVVDAHGDGLELADEDVINLYLQNTSGSFTKFDGRDPEFTYRANFVFYATLGNVADDFGNEDAFPGTEEVRVVIDLDDYPWDIGLEMRADHDNSLVWYRPPRYYAHEVRETIVEVVSLPAQSGNYTLTVGDTYGDGLGGRERGVRITTRWDRELGSTSFETGFCESITFFYNLDEQAPPTASPVEPTLSPASSSTTSQYSISMSVLPFLSLLFLWVS